MEKGLILHHESQLAVGSLTVLSGWDLELGAVVVCCCFGMAARLFCSYCFGFFGVSRTTGCVT